MPEPSPRTLIFEVEATLTSKSNHRTGGRSDWQRLRAFADLVAMTARQHRPPDWPLASESQSTKAVVVIVADTRVDAANAPKTITDALEGVLYDNDRNVLAVTSITPTHTVGRTFLGVAVFEGHPSAETAAQTLSALTRDVLTYRAATPQLP